jgi:hypothetical protein
MRRSALLRNILGNSPQFPTFLLDFCKDAILACREFSRRVAGEYLSKPQESAHMENA